MAKAYKRAADSWTCEVNKKCWIEIEHNSFLASEREIDFDIDKDWQEKGIP